MQTRFSFVDPGMIMGVVITLIILAVGVFAFFVTIGALPSGEVGTKAYFGSTYWSENGTFNYANVTTDAQVKFIRGYNQSVLTAGTGTSVFNILGIVLIIGAILTIVGLVYNYVR